MTTNRKRANRGAGFTLVEILVVIVIIGLLAGITSTVLVSARQSARGAVVATQMAQLSMALDEYKNQFGEYPPDFSDPEAVMRHVKKRWPRYNVASYAEFLAHIRCGCRLSSSYSGYVPNAGALGNIDYLFNFLDGPHVWDVENPASALVFWLGGLPDVDGKPSGFYANPKAPLGVGINGAGRVAPLANPLQARREAPLFDFELKNIDAFARDVPFEVRLGMPVYNPENVYYPAEDNEIKIAADNVYYLYAPVFQQGDLPIVYFRPSANIPYGHNAKAFRYGDVAPSTGATITRAVPYMRDAQAGVWYEDKRFQMVHPGVDGMFGPDEELGETRQAPNGDETILAGTLQLSGEDDDNIVNFAENGTLLSEYEE